MRVPAILFAALSILLGQAGWAAEPHAVRVAAQIESEPKFVAQGGAVAGNCIDIFRAIERVEPAIRFIGDQQWLPLKRIEAMIAGGKLDAACGVLKTDERIAAYKIPDTPLLSVTYHLVARADDEINPKSWDEIRRLNADGIILVNAGSGPVSMLKKIGNLRIDSTAPSTAQNIEKLLAGRGRFFYYRNPGLNSEIRKSGFEGRVRVLPSVFDTQAFYMILGLHLSKDVEAKITQALLKLNEHHELRHIADKWASH